MNSNAQLEIFEKAHKLALRKNNDYASAIDNIALTGPHGVAVRLLDKVARVYSLTTPGIEQKVKDESIDDTLIDIINYASFALMLRAGKWGDTKEEVKP